MWNILTAPFIGEHQSAEKAVTYPVWHWVKVIAGKQRGYQGFVLQRHNSLLRVVLALPHDLEMLKIDRAYVKIMKTTVDQMPEPWPRAQWEGGLQFLRRKWKQCGSYVETKQQCKRYQLTAEILPPPPTPSPPQENSQEDSQDNQQESSATADLISQHRQSRRKTTSLNTCI